MTRKQRDRFVKFFAILAIAAMLLGGIASSLVLFLS
jgi:uncharacterized membrane protein